jgi:hypothetical protein
MREDPVHKTEPDSVEQKSAIFVESREDSMSTTMTVPVTIAPEARAFIERVGQREELDLMLERAKRVVPGLMAIEVELGEATDEIPAAVVFWTHRDDIGPENDPTQQKWIEWMAATFPPEFCQNFVLLPLYRANGR